MLNQYAETASKNVFTKFLSIYFLIQLLWGCLSWGYAYFGNGYSALSFMGIYLLSRFARINHLGELLKCYQWLISYILLSLIGTTIAFTFGRYLYSAYNLAYSYASPIIILSSISFLCCFSKIKLQSSIVNWISKHCFGVYLFHMNIFILPFIIRICKQIGADRSLFLFCIVSILGCLLAFTISILLDICRLFVWNLISTNIIYPKNENYL